MSDYQAIFDAVNLNFSGASHAIACIQQEFGIAAGEMQRPSVLYRPALYPDGNKWCALYGANLQEGVAGFGDTPADAMRAFDAAWSNEKAGRAAA